MFDPEKVKRHYMHVVDGNSLAAGVYVQATDYDDLLALYRGSEQSRKAAMRLVERLTDVLRSLRED